MPSSAESQALGVYHFYRDGRRALLFTENETNARRLFGLQDAPRLLQGRLPRVRGRRARRGRQPRAAAARRWRRTIGSSVPADGHAVVRLRLSAGAARQPFADFDELFATRRREADEFYADACRHDLADADAAAGAAPGVRRHDLEQAVLLLRRAAVAERRSRRSRRRRPSASTAATPTGATSTTPTSSRCPTSGSIPGTRRGISRSTASRWR